MYRQLQKVIQKDLQEKYVFLAGPRQSGKTTLSKQLFDSGQYQYLNYDRAEDRQLILLGHWDRNSRLVILDEFHKYPTWKTVLKGYYDTEGMNPAILVTGSARLDVYRKGNDSMVGRYFLHHLFPLSVKELSQEMSSDEALGALLTLGSFPEPLLKGSQVSAKRWKQQYLERVIREDVTDLSNVRDLVKIQLLIDLLRQRVGSQISYTSLARDLDVAPKTVIHWVNLLEQLYIIFKISPYHRNVARSILKEPKIYFYDVTMAFDSEAHLENLVAFSLLKNLRYQEDVEGIKGELYYLRTKDSKEVDFLTVQDRQIQEMIEVKTSDDTLHKGFNFFRQYLKPKRCLQLVQNIRQPKTVENVSIQSVVSYLESLKA